MAVMEDVAALTEGFKVFGMVVAGIMIKMPGRQIDEGRP